jgi:hypothetical protein
MDSLRSSFSCQRILLSAPACRQAGIEQIIVFCKAKNHPFNLPDGRQVC